MLIDSHSHLFLEEFADDLPEVMERVRQAGITHLFMPNIDSTTVERLNEVCRTYSDLCYPMAGLHPTSVGENYRQELAIVEAELQRTDRRYVAVGEIGLDFYWDATYKQQQTEVFERQIEMALEHRLPIVIHARNAFNELCEVMNHYADTPLSGVFHSFTGTAEEAERLLRYERFMIGINGVVTFKKSTLPEALKAVPLSRVVAETDCPYLTPAPFRGRRNESTYVELVVRKLAEVYDTDYNRTSEITSNNALKLFNL
jgi:TatD DNase family protein